MRWYEEELVNRINKLCDLYKNYIIMHDDSRLNILIQDSSICFKLFNYMELVDEFVISFGKKEMDIYTYLSMVLVKLLFNENKIFNGDNKIYNMIDNPSLILEINDVIVFDVIIMMMGSKDTNKFYDSISNNLVWRFYPRKFMKSLDERIVLSRKLLRMDDVE